MHIHTDFTLRLRFLLNLSDQAPRFDESVDTELCITEFYRATCVRIIGVPNFPGGLYVILGMFKNTCEPTRLLIKIAMTF